MSTIVKICGIKNDALFPQMQDLPLDMLGFVLAPSTRQLTALEARELVATMRRTFARPPLAVAVFRNQREDELREMVAEVKPDVVQLHGAESPELCRQLRADFKVMKVFSLQAGHSSSDVRLDAERYVHAIDYVLLDTFDPVYGGGSGKTFRWEIIKEIGEWCRAHALPLLVAGGLSADNVAQLLQQYRPDGVDISSGVETNGQKDILKMTTFVERVRAHDYSS